MKANKNKKCKMLKGERVMYTIILLLVVCIPLSNVVTSALLSETNIEVERLRKQIDLQNNKVVSLNMQINELVSLENIQDIAEIYGLSYVNGNIKVISNE